jgi:hypothetical protein
MYSMLYRTPHDTGDTGTMGQSTTRVRRTTLREQRKRHERVWLVAIIAALSLLIAAMLYAAFRPRPGRAVPSLGNQHIQPPQRAAYNTTPPTSGSHYTTIAPWGVHDEPIPNELQVHNLEDGGVLVQYNCPEECPGLVGQLTALVRQYPEGVILAPYPGMEARIALTAWGRIDTLQELDENRILRFIRAYRGIDHHR